MIPNVNATKKEIINSVMLQIGKLKEFNEKKTKEKQLQKKQTKRTAIQNDKYNNLFYGIKRLQLLLFIQRRFLFNYQFVFS